MVSGGAKPWEGPDLDELRVGPGSQGALSRRLGARGGGRRAAAALVAGVFGLAAFVASLLLDWVNLTIDADETTFFSGESPVEVAIVRLPLGPANGSYSVVYELGVLALVGLLAFVVLRPDLAARWRVAATALGTGVGCVVMAVANQLSTSLARKVWIFDVPTATIDADYLPGVYLAGGAVVGLVAGVWLAAVPGGPTAASPTPEPTAASARGSSQRALIAYAAGVVGAGALVASMLLAWQGVRADEPSDILVTDRVAPLSLDHAPSGVAYLVAALILVSVLGAVVTRPDLAARLRLGAAGVGLGTAGILVATVFEMRDWLVNVYLDVGAVVPFALGTEESDAMTYSINAGLYLGFGSILALVAGVWFAAVPAVTRDPDHLPAVHPTAPVPSGPAVQPQAPAQVSGPAASWLGPPVGRIDGLSLTASEPIDVGPQTDILRS